MSRSAIIINARACSERFSRGRQRPIAASFQVRAKVYILCVSVHLLARFANDHEIENASNVSRDRTYRRFPHKLTR